MNTWTIRETANGYAIEHRDGETVWPTTMKATKREAAARLLQLMGIGPVRPQMTPERVGIGFVETTPEAEG